MDELFLQAMQNWMVVFMRRSMSKFRQYMIANGLSMTQMTSMFLILHSGSCSISDLATQLDISNAAASQLIERLVQQDLLTRTEDPSDRRNKLLELTEKGKTTVAKSMQARQLWLQELVAILGDTEKKDIISAFEILTAKAEALTPPSEPACPGSN